MRKLRKVSRPSWRQLSLVLAPSANSSKVTSESPAWPSYRHGIREPLVRNRFGDSAAVAISEAFVFDVELKLEADFRSEFTEVERPLT